MAEYIIQEESLKALADIVRERNVDMFLVSDRANLALTSLPEGITQIGNSAFRDCTNLALTSLPESLTKIDNHAFRGCTNLAITSLPAGITSIGVFAFAGCKNITSITFKGTPKTIGNYAFEFNNYPTPITINVPWAEGAVAGAPWGATNVTINYNYTEV